MSLVEVTWNNLTLKTEENFTILDNISGQFKPGTVTAIVGPEGSGKSSFIKSFTGRISKSLKLQGEILVNGRQRDPVSWPKIIACIEREFEACGYQTVYETLKFAAIAKLPEDSDINGRINETLVVLGLLNLKNRYISTLSYLEKARISIGLEFVDDPSVWFLDEPTYEFDALNSLHILEILQNLAKIMNKTVVLTINDPSFGMFKYIDSFILIASGSIIFDGTFNDCYDFFNRNGFVVPDKANPVSFFVEAVTVNQRSRQLMKKSNDDISKLKNAWDLIKRPYTPTIYDDFVFQSNRRYFRTFLLLLSREKVEMIRNKKNIKVKIFDKLVTGLLLGLLFLQIGVSIENISELGSALVFIITSELFTTSSYVFGGFTLTSRIVKREKASGYYNGYESYSSKVIAVSIYCLIFEIPCITMIYYLIGLNSNFLAYFEFIMVISLLAIFSISFGLTFQIVFQDIPENKVLEIGINLMFILFSGAFIAKEDMPVFLSWLTWISPAFYAFNAIFQDQYSQGFPDKMETFDLLESLGAEYIGIWSSIFVLAGMSFVCQIVGAFELERRVRNNFTISKL